MQKKQFENLIAEFEVACRAAGLKEKTISWYTGVLHHYQTFELQQNQDDESGMCTVPSLRRYFAALQTQKPYSHHTGRPTEERSITVETILAYGRALKRFCNWLAEEDYLESSPMARIRLPRRPRHIPRDVSRNDINALLDVVDYSRDKAIVLFFVSTGVRSSELRNLRLADVDLEQRIALVRGKGDKERFVIFDSQTASAIEDWLEERPETKGDYLFPTFRGGQLTESGLRQIIRRLREKAEITNPVSPHRFRHAFAKNWMMQGGDEFSLAKLMGHEDISTTRIYSQFRLAELREKYDKIQTLAKNNKSAWIG